MRAPPIFKSVLISSLLARSVDATGPAPIALGSASNFVILAAQGISVVLDPIFASINSLITGNMGITQQTSDFGIQGFDFILDSSQVFATVPNKGDGGIFSASNLFAPDFLSPTPGILSTADADLQAAFNDGLGRTNPDFVDLFNGNIQGMTLLPGLYTWTGDISLISDGSATITLSGGPNDTWIFQVNGDLEFQSVIFSVTGGANPKNIFWVIGGDARLTGAGFTGIVMAQNDITLTNIFMPDAKIYTQNTLTLVDFDTIGVMC